MQEKQETRKIILRGVVIILAAFLHSCGTNKITIIDYNKICNEYIETEKNVVLGNLFKDLKKRRVLSINSIWYSLNSLDNISNSFSKEPSLVNKCISKEMRTLFSIWLISKGAYKENCSDLAYLYIEEEVIYDLKMDKGLKVSYYNKKKVDKIKKEYFLWYKNYLKGDTSLNELSNKYNWIIAPPLPLESF